MGAPTTPLMTSTGVYSPAFWKRLWRLSGINFIVFSSACTSSTAINRTSVRRPTLFSTSQHRRNRNASFTQTTGIW